MGTYLKVMSVLNYGMDIYEIRRLRLRELIDSRFDGVVKRCAEALEMKPPQLHRWLSLTSKDRRRIEYDSARGIEAKLGLANLWLDNRAADVTYITDGDVTDEMRVLQYLTEHADRYLARNGKPLVIRDNSPEWHQIVQGGTVQDLWPFERITRERYFALHAAERAAIEEKLEHWIEAYEAARQKKPHTNGVR